MRGRSERGILLLYTLAAMATLFTLALGLLGMFRGLHSSVQHDALRRVASAGADSGLAEAYYQLTQDKLAEPAFAGLAVETGATYTVTFDRTQPCWSTSNAAGDQLATGWGGRLVPAGYVHLVSLGHYGGVQDRREALIDVNVDPPLLRQLW